MLSAIITLHIFLLPYAPPLLSFQYSHYVSAGLLNILSKPLLIPLHSFFLLGLHNLYQPIFKFPNSLFFQFTPTVVTLVNLFQLLYFSIPGLPHSSLKIFPFDILDLMRHCHCIFLSSLIELSFSSVNIPVMATPKYFSVKSD